MIISLLGQFFAACHHCRHDSCQYNATKKWKRLFAAVCRSFQWQQPMGDGACRSPFIDIMTTIPILRNLYCCFFGQSRIGSDWARYRNLSDRNPAVILIPLMHESWGEQISCQWQIWRAFSSSNGRQRCRNTKQIFGIMLLKSNRKFF